MTTIDMQTIRYINLLDKYGRVKTSKCFSYNNTIIYVVPRALVSQAIGEGANNLHHIQEQIGKRVKVVADANEQQIERFIKEVISPVGYTGIAVSNGEVVITAGMHHKAALLGRNRRRQLELAEIVKNMFGLGLKIV